MSVMAMVLCEHWLNQWELEAIESDTGSHGHSDQWPGSSEMLAKKN